MRPGTLSVLAMCVSLAAACGRSSAPKRVIAPEPRDAASAALGVVISMQTPDGQSIAPDVVYFLRLAEGQTLDTALSKQELVTSNLASGGRNLLLNATPGSYVAVAAGFERDIPGLTGRMQPSSRKSSRDSLSAGITIGKRRQQMHRVYLSEGLVEKSRLRVAAGDFDFMGEVSVALAPWGRADEVQTSVRQLVEGDPALRLGQSSTIQPWLGEAEAWSRDRTTELQFLNATAHSLSSSRWSERITRRLSQMQTE